LKVNEENKDNDNLFQSAPLIKYSYFDDNNDGLIDRFNFKITFLAESHVAQIKNIKLVFFFRYEFKENVVGKMNTVAMADIDTPLGASYIKVDGNLNLQQKNAIDRTTFYNENIYRFIYRSNTNQDTQTSTDNNYQLYDFNTIAQEYYSRDFSTLYDYDTYIVPMKNPRIVRLEVNINIPSFQKILYSTPLFTKIKFFWAQYVSVLIPIAGIFYFIMQFAFRNHIVDSINSNDIGVKKKKIL
jgi:hypothetical protein